jgi:hypothetical protein
MVTTNDFARGGSFAKVRWIHLRIAGRGTGTVDMAIGKG